MPKQKIVIIGGGIAGLSTGIYAQLHGFDTLLLERHTITGGECTGWMREGFHIDNCIHWMTGTSPQKSINRVWRDVAALGDDVEIIQHSSFMRVDDPEGGNANFHIWADLKRMEDGMLAVAPEDEKVIRQFMAAVERYRDVDMPSDLPPEERNLWWYLKTIWKLRRVGKVHRQFAKMTIRDIADQFKNEHIRQSMLCYLPDSFFAEALLYMYATFSCGNGALPKGGSLQMVQRMQKRYEDLGGKVQCRAEAKRIVTEGDRAVGVELIDGSIIEADIVVAACDPAVTYLRLLAHEPKHQDPYFMHRYAKEEQYPVFSHMEIFFGSDVRIDDENRLPSSVAFHATNPISIVGREHRNLLTKHYQYEPDYAPEGKMVMQVMILQNGEDFDKWKQLREDDIHAYRAEKARVAEEVRLEVEKHFPELAGQLHTVEVVTPHSFHRYCGAHKGCYMPFIIRPDVKKEDHNGRIPNLRNGYLAGQWLQPPGGLPNAVVTGKFAVQRICKDLGLPWKW